MDKEKRFRKIVSDIKTVKIQGARNIARAALYAYSLNPTDSAENQLINARPTEPMLVNVLHKFEKQGYRRVLKHFDEAQKKINKFFIKIIKQNKTILTHCHSTNVINALIYAKKHSKKFQVYNTETRPLFQGRKTSKELTKAGIKVTMIQDSAVRDALTQGGMINKADYLILGADAILKDGIINKIGSAMFSEIAYDNKIPVYIIADSWKFSQHNIKIEERNFHEIWKNAPKNIKIMNPAFEKIPSKYIKGIISELGILSYKQFLRKINQ